jgi:hypothetical protein
MRLDVDCGQLKFDALSMHEEGGDRSHSQSHHRASPRGAAIRLGPAACRGLLDGADSLSTRFIALKRDLHALEVQHLSMCVDALLQEPQQSASAQDFKRGGFDDGLAEEILLTNLIERAVDLGATCRNAIPVPEPLAGVDDLHMHEQRIDDARPNEGGAA